MQSIKTVRTNEEDRLAGTDEGNLPETTAKAIRALEDWELALAGGGDEMPQWH